MDDVGYASKERDSWSDGSVTGCEREVTPTPPAQSIDQHDGIFLPEPSSDEDVFDFGRGLDEA